MHRSNFRAKKQSLTSGHSYDHTPQQGPSGQEPPVNDQLEALQEQIQYVCDKLLPMKGALETLLAQQRHDNDTVPEDLGKAIRSVLERLDRLERNQAKTSDQFGKMQTTFSNALLKMGDQVEKISGGVDSEFSLAHSMETLIDVLSNRKYRVIRDNDGNMAKLETDMGKKYS